MKIHAAYHAAARTQGQPTVILAQTKKGYGDHRTNHKPVNHLIQSKGLKSSNLLS